LERIISIKVEIDLEEILEHYAKINNVAYDITSANLTRWGDDLAVKLDYDGKGETLMLANGNLAGTLGVYSKIEILSADYVAYTQAPRSRIGTTDVFDKDGNRVFDDRNRKGVIQWYSTGINTFRPQSSNAEFFSLNLFYLISYNQ